jgi:Polysaccharide deacetylase
VTRPSFFPQMRETPGPTHGWPPGAADRFGERPHRERLVSQHKTKSILALARIRAPFGMRRAVGSVAFAIALTVIVSASPSAMAAQTIVSLTFDDGIATQNFARTQLSAHGMRGTFYINSGTIGTDPYFMSWSDVDALNAAGNEIAGHTVDHVRLTNLTPAQQHQQICDDADALRARGYTITSFAYPFGAGINSPSVRSALVDCGFVSARKYGDLRGSDCPDPGCPTAEAIPTADPYAVNSTGFEMGALTVQKLQTWVTQAESNGGGWVPVVFHDICNACDDASVSQSVFQSFLDWLQPRAAGGTIVRTMREVMLMSPAYVRPRGATPFRVPLVPAYEQCTAPDSTHGGPLSFDSCTSPEQSSGFLAVGTPDANGRSSGSVGSLVLKVIAGDATTTVDETDVRIQVSLTDVRRRADHSDYTGELAAATGIRLTDRLNGSQQTEPGTTSDFDFDFAVPCTGTSDATIGSTCSLSTTADALEPGIAKEGSRAVWGLAKVLIDDGGPDGVAATEDNTQFVAQGLFAP